jgi:methyl-accepting chemotaxis protein
MNIAFWILFIFCVSISFLCFNFWQRLRTLKKSIESIADTSFDLTGSSEQIASVSRDLESASMEQLNSISETISASSEINSMIHKTNDSTKELTTESKRLTDIAGEGGGIIEKMVFTSLQMKEGSEYFRTEIEESMDELSRSLVIINEIADKTQLINDIVFQTRLLSFNASVEAARAGEHGKGFSVVAEEIGKLALMSGKISGEISKIVESSVSSINQSIDMARTRVDNLTSESSKKNEDGYFAAKNGENVFNNISHEISRINGMIEEISIATVEQSVGIKQLDLAIINLQEVANRNRLLASQSSEHAQEFEIQTKKISDINKEMAEINHFDTYKKPRLKKFVWSDKLSLGIHEMDDEHQKLIVKINNFVGALEQQYTAKNVQALLLAFNDLAGYTVGHFKSEEA